MILDLSKAISRKRCKIGGKLLTNRKSRNELSIGTNIGDVERCNVPYFALFHFTNFVYDVVVKRLLGLPRFQSPLMIVYDHINAICAIIQRLFRQNKSRQWPLVQTVVA